jgi:hypothetical protein
LHQGLYAPSVLCSLDEENLKAVVPQMAARMKLIQEIQEMKRELGT